MLSGLFYKQQQLQRYVPGKLAVLSTKKVFKIETLFLNNSVGLLPQMIEVIKDDTLQSDAIYIMFWKPQHFYLRLHDLICFQ